jgi:hypothetical protein
VVIVASAVRTLAARAPGAPATDKNLLKPLTDWRCRWLPFDWFPSIGVTQRNAAIQSQVLILSVQRRARSERSERSFSIVVGHRRIDRCDSEKSKLPKFYCRLLLGEKT